MKEVSAGTFFGESCASSLARVGKKKITPRRRGLRGSTERLLKESVPLYMGVLLPSERESLGKDPAMIVAMKPSSRDLDPCRRRDTKPRVHVHSSKIRIRESGRPVCRQRAAQSGREWSSLPIPARASRPPHIERPCSTGAAGRAWRYPQPVNWLRTWIARRI